MGPENHIKLKTYRIQNKTAAKLMYRNLPMYLLLYGAWTFLGSNGTHFLPFQGPKSLDFSGPTLSSGPGNGYAPIKII
jgi:hypothetical protein